jgi:hypothetical protein
VNDCRVDISGTPVRVISDSGSFDTLRAGQKIFLALKEFIVYPDTGSDDDTKIIT